MNHPLQCCIQKLFAYLPAYSTDHFLNNGMNNPAIRGSSTLLNHCTNVGCFSCNWLSMNSPRKNVFEEKLKKDEQGVSPHGSISSLLFRKANCVIM